MYKIQVLKFITKITHQCQNIFTKKVVNEGGEVAKQHNIRLMTLKVNLHFCKL